MLFLFQRGILRSSKNGGTMKSKDRPVYEGKTDNNGIPIPKEGPAAAISEQIEAALQEKLSSNDFDVTEISGLFALGSLLTKVSGGLLDPKQEFSFLKSLAEKKTQNPVQRIEQRTKVDLRVSIASAIEASPGALERTLEIAKKHNTEVLERLNGDLMLDGDSKEELALAAPDEPYELRDLKTGGDGSVKIQSFRDRISNGETSPDQRSVQQSFSRREAEKEIK